MSEYKHSIKQCALQLRDQLSSDKRKLGFFFGAGTSMAVGIPGVFALTKQISDKLAEPFKSQFEQVHKGAESDNIEEILNKLRTIREYRIDRRDYEYRDNDSRRENYAHHNIRHDNDHKEGHGNHERGDD